MEQFFPFLGSWLWFVAAGIFLLGWDACIQDGSVSEEGSVIESEWAICVNDKLRAMLITDIASTIGQF